MIINIPEPKCCSDCLLSHYNEDYCYAYPETSHFEGIEEMDNKHQRPSWCPLESEKIYRWIPVTEQMPEEYEVEYPVTIDDQLRLKLEPHKEKKSQMCLVTSDYQSGNPHVHFNYTVNGEWQYATVSAWMPVPDPYEGVGNQSERIYKSTMEDSSK